MSARSAISLNLVIAAVKELVIPHVHFTSKLHPKATPLSLDKFVYSIDLERMINQLVIYLYSLSRSTGQV